jgi:hypothetical protein
MQKVKLNRREGVPRFNEGELVMLSVSGKIAPPLAKSPPYRIGQDGLLRVLPGTGGITFNHRVGDLCVGLAADHVEPGVSVRNDQRSPGEPKNGANLALNTFACIGNGAIITSGPAAGARGVVTGKHGGIENVLVDYPLSVMKRLRIGDGVQVFSIGQGMRFEDFPDIAVLNASPRLIRSWGLRVEGRRLGVGVTHLVPAAIMGSGLGKSSAARGDYDIQLFDPSVRKRYRLGSLRFGDIVAIVDADGRFGRAYSSCHITIGIVVHGDSTVAGHGPGVVTLLSGPASRFVASRDREANIARILSLRTPAKPVSRKPLIAKTGAAGQPRRPVCNRQVLQIEP